MTYPAMAVANSFIDKGATSGRPLTHMKLQKLVYFADGWNLAFADNPLISDQIQAWQYGPVIPSIYHEFKDYGNGVIQNKAIVYRVRDGKIEKDAPSIPETDEFSCKLVERVWEVYGGYSAVQLSAMTHEEGTPWHKVYLGYGGGARGLVIPRSLMKEYFSALKERNASGED